MHASPFYWLRIPADFAWATFILAYLHGIDIQARHSHPFLKKKKIELLWKRVVSWLLVFCSIWYTLLEAAGVIYSLRPKQGFFVIQKPSLAAENKIDTTQCKHFSNPGIQHQWRERSETTIEACLLHFFHLDGVGDTSPGLLLSGHIPFGTPPRNLSSCNTIAISTIPNCSSIKRREYDPCSTHAEAHLPDGNNFSSMENKRL